VIGFSLIYIGNTRYSLLTQDKLSWDSVTKDLICYRG